MLAYHGKKSIKVKYLNRVIRHKKADELRQGYGYFKDGKGCAVGCTIHGADHHAYETELGIPVILAKLEDRIFEGLPVEEARKWPSRFLRAISPGADLSGVWNKFAVWLLTDPEHGVIHRARSPQASALIQRVSDLYLELVEGRTSSARDFRAAAAAAYADYADAADYADYAAYAAAAYAADYADAADYAAYAVAADAAAYAAAAYAVAADAAYAYARKQVYVHQSKKLLQLLKEAK